MNPKIVIDPILNARDFLEKSEHEKSFELIKEFFESQKREQPNVLYLQKHLQIVKTRYFRLIKEKEAGIVDYKDYDKVFNQISDALFSFFNSVLHECEEINNKSTAEGIISRPNKVSAVLVFDLKFENYSEEDILATVNDIRKMLGLKEHEFKYLSAKSGSIIIHFEMLRSYDIGVKLMSSVKVKWVDQLISFHIEDSLMNQYCLAISELYIDLSHLDFQYTWGIINLKEKLINAKEQQSYYLKKSKLEGLSEANLFGANLHGANLHGVNLRKADLRKTDLRKANLHGADLRKADLRKANLFQANLFQADLRGAFLKGVRLIEAKLIEAELFQAELSGADLYRANLDGANLRGAMLFQGDLRQTNLSEANLHGADLSEANLFRADLSRANLFQANLSKTMLIEADLSEANLRRVKLGGAKLSGATLSGAMLSGANLRGLNLRGVDLNGVDVSGADLSRAKLFRADLSKADLRKANLFQANLIEVNLFEADLRGADLRGADLHGAKLHGADLSGADLSGTELSVVTTDKTIFSSSHISYLSIMGVNLETCIFVDSLGKHSTIEV